jgi:aerobic-type carbon monoxide dehydrogenase small subunit (CoxS/CutS family)
MAESDRLAFTCNGTAVEVAVAPGESLLSVLRERLAITSVKDGCAPQGQCGCCTVLVDGEPRVACVTPAPRVAGRTVTTVEGLDPALRDGVAASFVATGGSQCGFCTPGIVVRAAALIEKDRTTRVDLDRGLAAHLCRCTGWQTVYDAVELAADAITLPRPSREHAARRAELEGGTHQVVRDDIPLGGGGFADDTAPRRDTLVAVPRPPGASAPTVEAAGLEWVVADSLDEARTRAGSGTGRRTTVQERPPLPLPSLPPGGVRVATSWVEPGYLEPDASWCVPGGEPVTPLANGGAFGGKVASRAPAAARELADRLGRAVRVVFSREDVVRLGPKRPPIAASAVLDGDVVHVTGSVAGRVAPFTTELPWPYMIRETTAWKQVAAPGPPTSAALRAVGLAERVLLVEGALAEAEARRIDFVRDARAAGVLLDACATAPGGALAGARVALDAGGLLERVDVRVAAGDPLDEVVLRSYCVGAAHMALGWVLSEGLAVDPDTGEVLDLTIRSFGIIRPKDTPPIRVTILDDPGEPLPSGSDAVFAAVAAATWNALTLAEGARPEALPADGTRAARALRR